MTPSLIPRLLLLLLGCSDAALPPENCEPPLPATDDDGAPWPTYETADAILADCEQLPGYARRRGSCSDGKRFLEASGGYEGEIRYFRDDTLVGVRRWTDVVASCNEYLFGDAQCVEVDVVAVSCS
jgi:hypothetical protein